MKVTLIPVEVVSVAIVLMNFGNNQWGTGNPVPLYFGTEIIKRTALLGLVGMLREVLESSS